MALLSLLCLAPHRFLLPVKYPPDWPDIARRIKERAGWRCENCGHPHDPQSRHVLTVHHLDLNPQNNSETNLVALCQRCHLSVQAHYRPGQLFLLPPPWWRERPTEERGGN